MQPDGCWGPVPKPLRFIRLKDTGEKKSSETMPLLFTVYLAACVESLLSVALFGCNFSIDKNLAIVAFTQFFSEPKRQQAAAL